MINRNVIRKIILEELIKKIEQRQPLNEGVPLFLAELLVPAIGLAAANAFLQSDNAEKVRSVTNANPQNNIYLRFKKFIDELENVVLPNDVEAKAIATELADATIYYTQGLGAGTIGRLTADLGSLGAGTNEEGVREAILKAKSKIGLAKVSLAFNEKFNKVFYDVFNDEFSATEANQYVIEPIIDLPFIIIKNEDDEEVSLTEEEFLAELKKAKAAAGGEKSEESGPSIDLGFGLDRPYVLNIIKTMNAYAKNKKIEGYTPAPEEDKWSPAVQDCWLKFAPHALNNCDLYNTEFTPDKIGGVARWPDMSSKMISKYPGYTPNPRGCLAFSLDAYYCDLKYGNQAPPSGGSGGRSSGGDGRKGEESKSGETKVTSSKKIRVQLAQTGTSFTGSGFAMKDGGNPDNLMIEAIINEMSAESKRAGYPGGLLTFFFVIDRKGRISDVRNEFGGGQNAGLNFPLSNLRRTLEDLGNRLIFPVKGSYSAEGGFDNPRGIGGKGIKVTFNIPTGNIEDLRPKG